MDLLAAMMRRAGPLEILRRTEAKAKRGALLRPWGLGVKRHLVDIDSSLARDDRVFMTDYAGDMVSGTAVFPIMSAIDSIGSIAELIAGRTESGDSHAGSLLTLSRMATESASKTIWLLSSTDRELRRSLSVRFTESELNAQRGFHSLTRKWFSGPGKDEATQQQKFLEHVRLFEMRVKMLERGKRETPKAKVLGSTDVVQAAARWLDNHPPRHDSGGRYGNDEYGFEDIAARFYNVSSAIVHGLKWPLDYIPGGEVDVSRMIVEGVNVAVSMVECAVALFEAQAQNWHAETDRPRLYPAHLQPTVEAWAWLYPAEQPG